MQTEPGTQTKAAGPTARREDERDLLPRHCRGDVEAFPELVAAYRAPVYSYLARCGVEGAQRDDLFQEIFLKVHRSAGRFDPDRPLHPWLFTIVANTVRNHLRKRRVRELLQPLPLGSAPEPSDGAPDGQRVAVAREAASWLPSAIAELPSRQRQVLLLTCVHELPLAEVAEALEMNLNTVKTCLRRARLRLGRVLGRRIGQPRAEETP